MPAILAEETLRERRSQLTSRQLYYLTLTATGDRDEAEAAWEERCNQELRDGKTPETL